MGSALILKVRICLKSSQPFFHQGRSAVVTLKTSLFKSSQLLPSARFLCIRHPDLGGRQTGRRSNEQTDRLGGIKNSSFRREKEKIWNNAVDGKGKTSTVRQKPSFPKSVFAAGAAKSRADMMKRKASLVSEGEEQQEEQSGQRITRKATRFQPPEWPLSTDEWRKLKESVGNPSRFEIGMMTTLLSSGKELDIAKSLLTFAAMDSGGLSYLLLLRYLTLCVTGGHDAEVFDVYDIMRQSFPSLDTGAATLFIKSFTRTARWRESISILDEVKKICTPSTRDYRDIITAAVKHGDTTTSWSLYDELIEKELKPNSKIWEALFQGVGKNKEEEGEGTQAMCQDEHQKRLLEVLLYMRDNQIYPQHGLANSIKTWFESLTGQKWTGSWTNPTPKGVCRCCGSDLESIQLTAEEYQQLKDRVMADIIHGQDVFKNTTPKELERFKMFVKRKPAFDVVVDGLNVANMSHDKSKRSERLLTVVSELQNQGLTVLVLGRKHMLRPSKSWDRNDMNRIQQRAHCFFTENISQDDPFLLYATLHSGSHCRFVSGDLMRDHKACLPDGASRHLFFKWQRGHQMVVDGDIKTGKRVQFQSVPSYDTIVQTSGDSWHIPYDDTENRSTHEVPLQWLCLTRKH